MSTNYFDGFANINFFLPSGIANGDTMLTVNNGGNATDLSDVKVGVAMQSGASLNKNDNVNLIVNANGLNNAPTALTEIAGEHITVAAPGGLITDKKYTFALSNSTDNKALVATVSNVEEVVAGGESGGNTDSGNTDSGSTDTYTSAEKPDADTVKNSQRLKSLVETQAASVTVLNSGADLLLGVGL
ncbi:MAG: hypothetical protein II651_10065, partial [Selenomonas sp.]|nr:hypothetical protein [Selenomonas sp.]